MVVCDLCFCPRDETSCEIICLTSLKASPYCSSTEIQEGSVPFSFFFFTIPLLQTTSEETNQWKLELSFHLKQPDFDSCVLVPSPPLWTGPPGPDRAGRSATSPPFGKLPPRPGRRPGIPPCAACGTRNRRKHKEQYKTSGYLERSATLQTKSSVYFQNQQISELSPLHIFKTGLFLLVWCVWGELWIIFIQHTVFTTWRDWFQTEREAGSVSYLQRVSDFLSLLLLILGTRRNK